jgi:Family of unknown function (DUF6502)
VRLLIARGVTFQMASELLKRVYVKAAQKHFVGKDDEATGTQLSLLTGLNRKEIRRLTADEMEESQPIPVASYASAVYFAWTTERRWRERNGKPKHLPRRATGKTLTFDDLVRSVTTDHRPSAILEELIRLGFIEYDQEARLVLQSRPFLPAGEFEDRLASLEQSTEDHLKAAVTNVLEEKPNYFLDRFIYSDELSEASAEKLHQRARDNWKFVQDDTVKHAIESEARDIEEGRQTKTRIRVGMYFYSETTDNE